MKIEVWSDFVCPFCYIGKRRLEQALDQLHVQDQVEVEFRSFELDPNAPEYSGHNIHQVIAQKYGISEEQARSNNEQLGQQATQAGLDFKFDTMKPTNTFDAHRLVKFAETFGKEKVVTEQIFHAYFTDSKLISDIEVLADLAASCSIDRQEVLRVLNDKTSYEQEVRSDEQMAAQFRITGVPYFIINRKYAISGAQPLENFVSALGQILQEEQPAPVLQDLSSDSSSDAMCNDNGCSVPSKEE